MRQKRSSIWQKLSFFIVMLLILSIVAYTAHGIMTQRGSYMRFGIDIKGGVSATFQSADPNIIPTDEQLDAAKAVIEVRLDSNNILDRTVTLDRENHCILVEFPWQATETEFDPVAAIAELGETAQLTFVLIEEAEKDDEGALSITNGNYTEYYTVDGDPFLNGSNVKHAEALPYNGQILVSLDFDDKGADIFADITGKHVKDMVGIMMDDTLISAAVVNEAITGGQATISGDFTAAEARDLANKINSGALPFAMESTNYSAVSATMGTHALRVMLLAGMIALGIIILFMCCYYRLPGFVASITLLLQTAGQLLAFHLMGLTLTLPGIAGIILSIGMGVDSNIIIAERIKEEVNNGKTLKGAISAGYNRAFQAVLDCNVTTAAVGILMLIFGTGAMLSFAYTLLIGIVLNFGLSIISSKLMLESLSCYKVFSSPRFYGFKAKKEVQE
ncbi:MAG: protein translocase subunit SecD [Clostridia bacterium]|nr:protein translocase subunit SecD [Clostridia bacterium]